MQGDMSCKATSPLGKPCAHSVLRCFTPAPPVVDAVSVLILGLMVAQVVNGASLPAVGSPNHVVHGIIKGRGHGTRRREGSRATPLGLAVNRRIYTRLQWAVQALTAPLVWRQVEPFDALAVVDHDARLLFQLQCLDEGCGTVVDISRRVAPFCTADVFLGADILPKDVGMDALGEQNHTSDSGSSSEHVVVFV